MMSVEYSEMMWVPNSGYLALSASAPVLGLLEGRMPARLYLFLGVVLNTTAFFGSYWALQTSFVMFVIVNGVMQGVAQAVLYPACVKLALQWFPHRKGLVGGITMGGYGGGAFIWNQVVTRWINPHNLQPDMAEEENLYFTQREVLEKVPTCYLLLGGIFTVTQLLCIVSLTFPPRPGNTQIITHHSAHELTASGKHSTNKTLTDCNSFCEMKERFENGHSRRAEKFPEQDTFSVKMPSQKECQDGTEKLLEQDTFSDCQDVTEKLLQNDKLTVRQDVTEKLLQNDKLTVRQDVTEKLLQNDTLLEAHDVTEKLLQQDEFAVSIPSTGGTEKQHQQDTLPVSTLLTPAHSTKEGYSASGTPDRLTNDDEEDDDDDDENDDDDNNNDEKHDSLDYTPRQILTSRVTWMLWLNNLTIDFGFIFTVAFYKAYGQTFIRDDHFLALVGSFAAVFNAAGRPAWGLVADRIGYLPSLLLAQGVLVVTSGTLITCELSGSSAMFFVWICAMFAGFSGIFALQAPLVSALFGHRHFLFSLGVVTSTGVVSTLTSVPLAGAVLEAFGWHGLFFLASGCVAFGMVLLSSLLVTCCCPRSPLPRHMRTALLTSQRRIHHQAVTS
ncbi:uncharacterized protein [Littorina saxatilis]|uniref:uncharacterized protein n=1 Tax=Littorina saxatilis TaxID=31220 RepID=UPI0038B69BD5